MNIFDDIKNQMKGSQNEIDETKLPWINKTQESSLDEDGTKKLSTKKITTVGFTLLIAIIAGIAFFNLLKGSNSISVEKSDAAALEDEDVKRQIQVHVAGEVNKPGVYKLDDGSRIMDAVNAAGGFTDKADQSSLNLAKIIEDGEQILISSIDNAAINSNSTTSNNGKININTADLSQLQTLNGVGPATAQKIIDYRNANGKFKTIEDLKKVSGIGDKTFEKFKDQICV